MALVTKTPTTAPMVMAIGIEVAIAGLGALGVDVKRVQSEIRTEPLV